jgi:hypothetical protein
MAKQLNLPLQVCEDLLKVSEELSLMAKKPVSPSMAVDLLIDVFQAHLNNPCTLDAFSMQLQTAKLMAPQEFDRYWDEPAITEASKKTIKAKKQ